MSSVNYSNPNTDRTVKIFDNFYNFEITVDANLYDNVLSFFKSVFSNESAAKSFTTTAFQMSEESGIPVVTIIEEMKGQNAIQLTATFAYFLNNLRSNSTLLGVSSTVTPNVYAARNVLT